MKTILTMIMILFPAAAMAEVTQCQVFSDGQVVCFPTGGSSTYGK